MTFDIVYELSVIGNTVSILIKEGMINIAWIYKNKDSAKRFLHANDIVFHYYHHDGPGLLYHLKHEGSAIFPVGTSHTLFESYELAFCFWSISMFIQMIFSPNVCCLVHLNSMALEII